MKIVAFQSIIKQTNPTDILFMTSDNTCIINFYMYQHPVHQVNGSKKGVLCTADYSKFFETPALCSGDKIIAGEFK